MLNRPGFKTISRQYMMKNYPVFIKPTWLGIISRQYIFGLRHWNHALINHWIILFKSLIANMAGFLLWLSITSIMIKVFKVLQRNGYYFINGYDLFYNGRNSPESLQAYNPALGGYIIQIEITCKSHVAASMHHDTWGLMQSHFY